MKSMKVGVWVLVGMGLAMLLSVGFLVPEASVSAQDSTDPVLVGAGDIASCSKTGDEATASLLEGINGTVATLGDNAYESGTASEYANCYDNYKLADGTPYNSSRPAWWGEFKARTMPSLGNHEYYTAGAQGYFDYFGANQAVGFLPPPAPVPNTDANPGLKPGKGYYSYDLGSWHVVVLNSNCVEVRGCEKTSAQGIWLQNDLANTTNKQCTLAYFHHPRFSSSGIGNNSAMMPFWEVLYDAGAEVVLNGHAHNYERFAPQTPDGQLDQAQGIREFVVGTGGKSLNSFVGPPYRPNSEVRLTDDSVPLGNFGVIKLKLHPTGYDWEFVTIDGTVDGTVDDFGSATCHGAPPTSTTDRPGPPSITTTDPGTNAPPVATTTNVTATFSEDMMASSINGKTFKLFKKGTSTKIAATVSYDPTTRTATLDPTSSLDRGVTYKAVVTTGAMDTVGNPLPQQYKWFFTTVR